MSTPKPIYESPWLTARGRHDERAFFSRDGSIEICVTKLREVFELGDTNRIKVAIFTSPQADCVKITESRFYSDFWVFCDGQRTCFNGPVDQLLLDIFAEPSVKTLYAKCYVED